MADGDAPAALLNFIKANAAFPLESAIREREATMHAVANVVAPDMILEILDREIAGDPYNPVMFWYATIQALRAGDTPRASGYLARLKSLGPEWPETRNAEDVLNAVAGMVEK